MEPLLCEFDAAHYLIFSENVFSPLIYYSHIGPLIVSLILGIFVLYNNPKHTLNRSLFAITISFSVWVFFDLILWASEKPEYIMFFWSVIVPVELLIYASCWYLVATFARRDGGISLIEKLFVFASFIPIFIFSHTSLNLIGFDYTNCDREAIEGVLIQYLYLMEIVYILWIIYTARVGSRNLDLSNKKQLKFITLGAVCFLLIFSIGNILVSYFLEVDWSYEQYKLFGMPVFVAFIVYSVIKFRTFNLRIFTTQALVTILAVLVFSMAFLRSIGTLQVVSVITFLLVCVLGRILIKNIRSEISRREEIEKLATDLKKANIRLKELDKMKSEFVSIASHQLRSPLAAIRGYASMLAEGSYGAFPAEAQDVLNKIVDSSKYMALSIEDYLNVSRIEAGNMKYEYSDFDLTKIAGEVVHELTPIAEKKGLRIEHVSDAEPLLVRADIGKMRQVIMNLVDNAMKYTKEGTITITTERGADQKKAYVRIHDTGVGISADALPGLFEKFVRAKNANGVNATGTGLGLFVAQKMTDQMGGKIWVESEGEGKGATFHVELPLAEMSR